MSDIIRRQQHGLYRAKAENRGAHEAWKNLALNPPQQRVRASAAGDYAAKDGRMQLRQLFEKRQELKDWPLSTLQELAIEIGIDREKVRLAVDVVQLSGAQLEAVDGGSAVESAKRQLANMVEHKLEFIAQFDKSIASGVVTAVSSEDEWSVDRDDMHASNHEKFNALYNMAVAHRVEQAFTLHMARQITESVRHAVCAVSNVPELIRCNVRDPGGGREAAEAQSRPQV